MTDGWCFRRANDIPDVPGGLTKKEIFCVCGKLVGHYQVTGWLRAAWSYMKRHAEGDMLGDFVGDATRQRLMEVVSEVRKADSVKGRWQVPKTNSGVVWKDASYSAKHDWSRRLTGWWRNMGHG